MDHGTRKYRFGDFVLDSARAVLRRGNEPIALRPKSWDLLHYLVTHADRLIGKDELMAAIWPSVVVTDDSLTRCIFEVRTALGEQGQEAIRTVPRRGYRFEMPVSMLPIEPVGPAGWPVVAPSTEDSTRFAGPHETSRHPEPPLGRDADLAALDGLVSTRRIVTVVGPGGVGKSRLARWWLWLHREDLDHGAVWIDLALVAEPAQLLGAVAAGLGVSGGGADAERSLIGMVSSLRLIVVLDNAEHLIEAVARLAQLLYERAPGLVVVVTCQAPLGLAVESVLRLAPLELPPVGATVAQALGCGAVALLVERSRLADARFALDEQNVAATIEVCRRLDGMPLAIELAAARMPLFGMARLADVLDERLRLLAHVGAGSRDALPRHRTLGAALTWSHGLLGDSEQALFRRLAVFAGTFSLGQAQQVVAGAVGDARVELDTWDVADALASLVERSMVAAELSDPPSWRLLDTTRLFAQQLLQDSGEDEAMRRRHASATRERFEHARAAMLAGRLTVDAWHDARVTELPEARAAVEWAYAHDAEIAVALVASVAHVQMGDFPQECRRLVERTSSLVDERVAPQVRARWLHQAALAFAAEQPSRAHRWAHEAAELHRRAGDSLELYLALCARLYWRPKEETSEEAAIYADELADIERAEWPAFVKAEGANALACWLVDERRFDEALDARRRSVHLLQRCGHAAREVRVQASLLDSLLAAGRIDEAIERGGELVARLAGSRLIANVPALRLNYAAALLRRGTPADLLLARGLARQSWLQAVALDWQAYWADYLAQLAAGESRFRVAAQLLGYSDAGYRKLDGHRDFNEQHAAHQAAETAAAALGPPEFAAFRRAGEKLSDDDVLELALGGDESAWVVSLSAGLDRPADLTETC